MIRHHADSAAIFLATRSATITQPRYVLPVGIAGIDGGMWPGFCNQLASTERRPRRGTINPRGMCHSPAVLHTRQGDERAPTACAPARVAAAQLLPFSSARGPFQNTCLVTQKGAPPMM